MQIARKLILLPVTWRWRYPLSSWKFWLKEVWYRDLDSYWCCSCIGAYGEQVCGCYAVTVWEHCVWSSFPHSVAVRLAPNVWNES